MCTSENIGGKEVGKEAGSEQRHTQRERRDGTAGGGREGGKDKANKKGCQGTGGLADPAHFQNKHNKHNVTGGTSRPTYRVRLGTASTNWHWPLSRRGWRGRVFAWRVMTWITNVLVKFDFW